MRKISVFLQPDWDALVMVWIVVGSFFSTILHAALANVSAAQAPTCWSTSCTSIRHGEVLVAASEQIRGWHNLGQAEAMMFWIVFAESGR